MPVYQCQVFIGSGDVASGWSEVYYNTSESITTSTAAFSLLIADRVALLPTDQFVVFARVSDTAIKGDGHAVPLSYPIAGTLADAAGTAGMENAVLIRQETADFDRGMRELRGVRAKDIQHAQFTHPNDWNDAFIAYKGRLTGANGWVLRVHKKGQAVVYKPITSVTTDFRLTHRNTGRPFSRYRGRRTARSAP